MRKNSIKNTRINGEVQKELSMIIRNEIKDPRIHPMTSVMAVEVAPDIRESGLCLDEYEGEYIPEPEPEAPEGKTEE